MEGIEEGRSCVKPASRSSFNATLHPLQLAAPQFVQLWINRQQQEAGFSLGRRAGKQPPPQSWLTRRLDDDCLFARSPGQRGLLHAAWVGVGESGWTDFRQQATVRKNFTLLKPSGWTGGAVVCV